MPDKLSVLRASYRVLKPGGMTGFLVISAGEHLTAKERARMVEDGIGPEYLDAGSGYPELMRQAGFAQVVVHDITQDYLATTEAWIRERAAEAEALRLLWGAERFEDRQASQRQSLQATADGRLRRYLVTGTRP
jgi:ubiquinone/menaquinone biosynthesis C-methylase UbiE